MGTTAGTAATSYNNIISLIDLVTDSIRGAGVAI